MPNTSDDRRTVRLVDVPVALYREVQQHTDDLLREIVLMADFEAASGTPGRASRLAGTAERHRDERQALAVTSERVLAAATGDAVTIEYEVAVSSATSASEWAALLEELVELCRDGTMLSVPAHDDVVAFSKWVCEEFMRQLSHGGEPRPWPEYART